MHLCSIQPRGSLIFARGGEDSVCVRGEFDLFGRKE